MAPLAEDISSAENGMEKKFRSRMKESRGGMRYLCFLRQRHCWLPDCPEELLSPNFGAIVLLNLTLFYRVAKTMGQPAHKILSLSIISCGR